MCVCVCVAAQNSNDRNMNILLAQHTHTYFNGNPSAIRLWKQMLTTIISEMPGIVEQLSKRILFQIQGS